MRMLRANLVYRQFTRVGAQRVPDAKTLGKLGLALGPEIIERIHQRVVAIAQEKKIVAGRKLRVDTTVVETDIQTGATRSWSARLDAARRSRALTDPELINTVYEALA